MSWMIYRALTPEEADKSEAGRAAWETLRLGLQTIWLEVGEKSHEPTKEDLVDLIDPRWLMGAAFMLLDTKNGIGRRVDIAVARTYSLETI